MMEVRAAKKSFYGSLALPAVLALAAVLLCAGAPRAEEPAGGQCQVVDRIVAVVNSDVICLSDLEEAMKPFVQRIKSAGFSLEVEQQLLGRLREDMVNQLVEQKLADQEIERLGVSVEDGEIDAAFERFKEEQGWTREDLVRALEAEGLDMDEYRKQLKEQLLRAKLVQMAVNSRIVITDEDIQRYYEEHAAEYAGESTYHLHNLVMPLPEGAPDEQRERVRQRLSRASRNVNEGMPFFEVRDRLRHAGLSSGGGDLGFFELKELTPSLQQVVSSLKPGQASGVFEAAKGYQIVWVEEIKAKGGAELDEIRPKIEREVYAEIVNKRYEEWVRDLKENSYIKIMR